MAEKITVRTKMRPEKEIEVGEAERLDLERLGVLVDTSAKTDQGARRAVERAAEKMEG